MPVERSDMSFGVSIDGGRIEYALRIAARPCSPSRATPCRRSFCGCCATSIRFNRGAEAAVADGQTDRRTSSRALGLGDGFRRYYLRPFCGAIWSTPEAEVEAFPATLLVRFLRNHGLLGLTGQHQWWTVSGGSRTYVDRLARRLEAGGVRHPRRRSGARRRRATATGVDGRDADGAAPERFDQVVLACHSDQALRLLDRPTRGRAPALGAIRYRANRGGAAPRPRPDAAAPRLLVELGLPLGRRSRRRASA